MYDGDIYHMKEDRQEVGSLTEKTSLTVGIVWLKSLWNIYIHVPRDELHVCIWYLEKSLHWK